MVTTDTECRDFESYALSRVHELAKAGQIVYPFRKVQRDIANLGYSPGDVSTCLLSITGANFKRSEKYAGETKWHDVYLVSYDGPKGCIDNLYIKLQLTDSLLLVSLTSFHI
jgi:hypothetical protein